MCGLGSQVREWHIWGLPVDECSVDSAVLATRSRRWPLMIDPQGQAAGWVRAMESRAGLRSARLTQASALWLYAPDSYIARAPAHQAPHRTLHAR